MLLLYIALLIFIHRKCSEQTWLKILKNEVLTGDHAFELFKSFVNNYARKVQIKHWLIIHHH